MEEYLISFARAFCFANDEYKTSKEILIGHALKVIPLENLRDFKFYLKYLLETKDDLYIITLWDKNGSDYVFSGTGLRVLLNDTIALIS